MSAVTNAAVIKFDDLYDQTPISTQYESLGIIFQNSTVLSSGISLNDFEFPPYSGTNVAFDDGGAIAILFSNPIRSVSGFFTYLAPLTLVAFDESGVRVVSVMSAFSSNMAISGDLGSAPNEFIGLSGLVDVTKVVITGDPGGSSFVLDNLTFVDHKSKFLAFDPLSDAVKVV
ncbi:MAG: hypothetical protein H6Q37_2176 [Chloroflexi bacterium]|nr:hypothetical protein [Chloroflexota bacterium]